GGSARGGLGGFPTDIEAEARGSGHQLQRAPGAPALAAFDAAAGGRQAERARGGGPRRLLGHREFHSRVQALDRANASSLSATLVSCLRSSLQDFGSSTSLRTARSVVSVWHFCGLGRSLR